MNRQVQIGGFSYKLISKKAQSACQSLYVRNRREQNLRLAEVYAGLWILDQHLWILDEHSRSIFLGLSVIMTGWLQNREFSSTEEGMLTSLVLLLGQPIKTQGIINLVKGHVVNGEYLMTKLLLDGGDHWYAKFEMRDSPQYWQLPRATLPELVNALC